MARPITRRFQQRRIRTWRTLPGKAAFLPELPWKSAAPVAFPAWLVAAGFFWMWTAGGAGCRDGHPRRPAATGSLR